MYRVLAIVPARSGSKGLRDKNIRKVGGLPMLVRAIHLAHASRRSKEQWRVIVSTDAERYARLARRAGAEVLGRRPRRLATGSARLIDVVLHTLDQVDGNKRVDAVLLLSAATPLTRPRDVRRALGLFGRGGGVSVASVTEDPTPDAWRFKLRDGRLVGKMRLIGRRQQATRSWVLNGAIYVATPAWLRRYGQFVRPGDTLAVPMAAAHSLDVENDHDLQEARRRLRE